MAGRCSVVERCCVVEHLLVFGEYLEDCVFEIESVDAGECDVFNVRDKCCFVL